MKKQIVILSILLLAVAPSFGQRRTQQQSGAQLTTTPDSISYALGFLFGSRITDTYPELEDELDFTVFQRAAQEALGGTLNWLDEDKLNEYVDNYFAAKRRAMWMPNIEAGERFLAENRRDPEVRVTASGLQYKVIQPGRDNNEHPREYDDMHITYSGKTLDGEEFISGENEYSYPASEIDGLNEGTQLMSSGAKYIFYIPAELAYGEEGSGKLKPYSVAIYEVEMISMTRDHNYYEEEEEDAVIETEE